MKKMEKSERGEVGGSECLKERRYAIHSCFSVQEPIPRF